MRWLITVFVLASCQSSEPSLEPPTPIPQGLLSVVFDMDLTNEIDDEFALAYAALSPERIKVEAIHAAPYSLSTELVVNGAVPPLQLRTLEKTLTDLGLDLDFIPEKLPGEGMELAFERAGEMATLLGITPTSGIHRGATSFSPEEPSMASENLVALAAENPLVVVATGALTNVAAAITSNPEIASNLTIIWTSAYPSFWPKPNASFNLVQDVKSANVVFESQATIHYLPGYFVGEKLRVSLPEIEERLFNRGEVGDFLYEIYEDAPLDGNHFGKSKVIWDMITVGYLINPTEWFETQTVAPIKVATDKTWTEGSGRRIIEAIDVDRDAIFVDFYNKFPEAQP